MLRYARGLLKADFQVIIGSRSLEKGKSAAEKLNSPLASAVEIDIADDDSINNAFNEAVDPGWVSSDMGGENAPRTTEQGADTAVSLATVDRIKDSGKLWRDCDPRRRHRSIVSF